MMVRKGDVQAVRPALKRSRVVGLLGPRQCGKTTLAREFVAPDSLNYFDLESPASLARLSEPETALRPLKALQPDEAYYWATHNGAELDLRLFKNGRRIGVECKRADTPTLTASMRTVWRDLKLDELRVVYPGTSRYPLGQGVEAVPLADCVAAQ